MKEFLQINSRGNFKRNIGFIESGIYYTKRDIPNIFNKYNGFGFSERVLNYCFDKNVNRINLVWNGSIFEFNLYDCFNGIEYSDDWDKQYIVPLNQAKINGSEFKQEKQEEIEVIKL